MSIILDRLTKLFGSHAVADQISLELANGEFFALLGSSGSGKSTILRMIAGLLQPDSGRILLHGRDVTHLPPQKRGMGFVFQNYSIFRHMTVAENVEFGLKIRKIAPEERARRCEQLFDLVGLAGLGNRYPDQLSGGQLQRVALARALAYEPNVLLLDEPFAALDSIIRAQMRRSLKEIQRRLKVTTILVTHDQEEAFELADRIGIIERGRLLETGRPETLYSAPRSLSVATLLGAGTILVGKADAGYARIGPLSLPIPPQTSHEDGASVQVLFRPEQVVLSTDKPCGEIPVLGRGKILEQTFSGSFQRVRLQLPHLAATRQAAPHVPFGEEGLVVDAIVPCDQPLACNTIWVGLRAWHILEQPRPRLLIYAGESDLKHSKLYIALARELSERLDASVTMLGVAEDQRSTKALRILLERQRSERRLNRAEMQLHYGNPAEQILNAQQDGFFDLMAINAAGYSDAMLIGVIDQSMVPVLVVRKELGALKRMLICTAAGEPGKNDVRAGGRLARRLRAAVTLLYVTPAGFGALSPIACAHLERAAATLRGLDVISSIRVLEAANPAAGILAEAQAGAHDLIVTGAHAPHLQGDTPDDVTSQVLHGTYLPVLVVPLDEKSW